MWISLLLLGCEPAPVFPPDPLEGVDIPEPGEGGNLPGPAPFVEGEERLDIGVFYEGESSEQVLIDDVDSFYFIFADEFSGQVTYSQSPSLERIEGFSSDLLTHGGGTWWGGGVSWNSPRDLSKWTTLHMSVRSPSEGFAGFAVAMSDGSNEGRYTASDGGFVPDDTWHHLAIDLDVLMPDRTAITAPLTLVGEGGIGGDELYIDNVYLTAP